MEDNVFYVKLTTRIVGAVIVLILSITAYNITDRIELGHVAYVQSIIPTNQ
jgi:hypothetical protein